MTRTRRFVTFLLAATMASSAAWDACKFQFGRAWTGAGSYSDVDYITIWIGDGSNKNCQYNGYWEGEMLKTAKSGGKTPVLYSYIIAFMARNKGGLQDCDVAGQGSSNSLCVGGTKYIRANRAAILDAYSNFAAGVAKDYGTSDPVVWLLEPDFYQYSEPTSYWGTQANAFSTAEAAELMTDIVARIKAKLPNAKLSFDISPWMGGTGWQAAQEAWWKAMPNGSFSYRNTSGGRTQGGNARIRTDANNLTTWAGIQSISKLGIIADDGYGVGGGSNGDWTEWFTPSNLNARIQEGVVALTVPEPGSDYGNKISSARAGITAKLVTCGGVVVPPTTYTLSLGTPTGGTLSATPAASSYEAGAKVSVTATPATGYKFSEWTGACSGTGTCTVTMNANQTVGATFAPVQASTFKLTLSPATGGSLSASPVQPAAGYASGASVTVTATAATGYKFAGWTGACSGTGTCAVTMTADKTVGATFAPVQASTFKLTLSPATGGSLSASPVQPAAGYASGASVSVTATAASGYQFAGWTGACSGTGTCAVTMDADKTVGAEFSRQATQTINAQAVNGKITFVPAGPQFLEGSSVQATAVPDEGYRFTGWQGACSGTATCSITIPNYAVYLGALFEKVNTAVDRRDGSAGFATVQGDRLLLHPGFEGAATVSLQALDGSRGVRLFHGWQGGVLDLDLAGVPRGVHVLVVRGQDLSRRELIRVGF